jgi:DNA-binding GntR family transcriptional regulator
MTIDTGSRVPFHEQLETILRNRIASGEINSRVPSIISLAQQYGVSRDTAVRALNTLAAEGLITVVRGKGFYVTERG